MIFDVLLTGAENAITARELSQLLDLPIRQVTAAVERERREGRPICSSNSEPCGYYIAADQRELAQFCRRQYQRGGEILKTHAALLAIMPTLPKGADP